MFDLLLRNGLVVIGDDIIQVDIAVKNGKIAAIGDCGTLGQAEEEFDVKRKYVFPGLIDPHIHMKHPYRDVFTPDDFFNTSVSAAFGGTTTVIDFAIQWNKEVSIEETVLKRRKDVEAGTTIDFALHATPTRSDQQTIDSVKNCVGLGIPSYKVYMVYREQGRIVEDPIILGLLQEMRENSALLMVHAENSSMEEYNKKQYVDTGRTAAKYFPEVKPDYVEAEAINRAIFFNAIAGSRLYIAHLSTQLGLGLIRDAQKGNQRVYTETCPHYLLLSDEVYKRDDGQNFLCSPPLRTQKDIDALWKGVADGTVSVISSDHCGFSLAQKDLGNGDFTKTPNGLPGIETRLSLIYTEGVLKRRITLNQMVKALSVNAAKIFSLYPQKGAIQIGSDADLCIFDGEYEQNIQAKELHGAVDWSPYEDMKVNGKVIATILRGQFIVRDNTLLVQQGFGKFIRRESISSDFVPWKL